MHEGKMPDFNVIKIGCIVVILLVLLIAAVIITVKREKSKRKIRSLIRRLSISNFFSPVREKYAGCVMQRKFSF